MLPSAMFVCPDCGKTFPAAGFCTEHGTSLVSAETDPLLGQVVGSYRIARKIGAGGMGQVYLAVQPNIGSRVAIKVLSAECAQSPSLVERFFAEARAVNLIHHDGIVSVHDLSSLPDGRPVIVMEYLDGLPLASLIKSNGALPLGTLTAMLGEVLAALGAAHDKGIVHRDLKPDNVFVTASGRVKLLDFGIAKLRPEQGGVSDATRTGSLLGTPHYMSPEQAQGMPADQRADLYSAGVILFEAATGQRPYPNASTLYELLKAHVEQMPPQPSLLRPEIPRPLEDVMLRALQKNPAHRFQSAGEFAKALSSAAHALSPSAFAAAATLTGSPGGGSPATPHPSFGASAPGYAPTTPPAPTTPAYVVTPAPVVHGQFHTLAAAPPPQREGLSALTIVLLILGFILIIFLGSCMMCTMCVGAAGA